MLLELHFIAWKVSTIFFFFVRQIIATTLLESSKENSTFLAVNFNFGKYNEFIYFYTLNTPPQRIYFRKLREQDEDIVHVSGDQGTKLRETSK